MSAKLQNILAFVDHGLSIVPIEPSSGRPVMSGGAKAAYSDPKLLRKLYKERPEYNYAVVPSGSIFILRAASNQARDLLIASHGGSETHLPKTVTWRVDNERYYLLRGKRVHSSHDRLGKGIDVYSEDDLIKDTFVLGPDGKLESGIKSRFVKERGLGEAEIAKCPQWLADLLTVPSAGAKRTTMADLLSIAKIEIERGENSWRKAAEALARAEKEFSATQREMAEAVGRSASWVNRLLQWHRSEYKEHSPFGPTTQAGRVSHAQQRATLTKRRQGKRSPPVKGSVVEGESAEPGTKEPVVEDDPVSVTELDWLKTELDSMGENYKRMEAELVATKTRLDQALQELDVARRSPATAMPGNGEIPPSLDRRPLSEEKQCAYKAIADGWANSPTFQAAWAEADPVVQHRFVREVLLKGTAS